MSPQQQKSPAPPQPEFILLDLLVLVLLSCSLLLFILWVLGKNPLNIPDSMQSAFRWATGLITTLGAAAVLRRQPPVRVYLIGMPVSLAMLLLLALAARFVFPDASPVPAPDVARRTPAAFVVRTAFQQAPGSPSPDRLDLTYYNPEMPTSVAIPVSRDSENFFESNFPFPGPKDYFSGQFARSVIVSYDAGANQAEKYITPIRFKRAAADPPPNTKGLALFNCIELSGCKLAPDTPAPGWVDLMAMGGMNGHSLFHSTFSGVVYAKDNPAASSDQHSWIVPNIAVLHDRQPPVGHTEFEVTLPATLAAVYQSYSFAVRANGNPVLIDGVPPDKMRIALPPNGAKLEFGLENLNFAGLANGCENIAVDLTFTPKTKAPVLTFGMWRQYIALRAADTLNIKGPNGASIAWSGTFYPGANRRELIVHSSPDLTSVQTATKAIDDAQFKLDDGRLIVAKLRAPLHTDSWGAAIGIGESTGQVTFTYTIPQYNEMLQRWNESWSKSPKIRALHLASPIPYDVGLMRPQPAEQPAAVQNKAPNRKSVCSGFGPA